MKFGLIKVLSLGEDVLPNYIMEKKIGQEDRWIILHYSPFKVTRNRKKTNRLIYSLGRVGLGGSDFSNIYSNIHAIFCCFCF